MIRMRSFLALASALAAVALLAGADDPPAKASPKEKLQVFQDLIGTWNGTGQFDDKSKGFWTEKAAWEWQFKGDDAWLKAALDKGKFYTAAELRYLPATDAYRLTLTTADKEAHAFEGALTNKRLVLERVDDKTKQAQRVTFSLLHDNRYTVRYETKDEGRPTFRSQYLLGATKEGVPFATGDGRPECVVSGGRGTTAVKYKDQTYYVCCSGCRDAFNDDPEKYIKEFEAKKKGK